MTIATSPFGVICAALVAFAFACGADDGEPDERRCDQEDRAVPYSPGMVVDGEDALYSVRIVDSAPAPPSKGDNDWIVDVLDYSTSTPVPDSVISVFPFMPDHGHGTPVETVITPTEAPGQFRVDRVNLWMPGYWEVIIYVDVGEIRDTALIPICIEG